MNELLKPLKDSWFIIVFIGGLIVTWTTFNARLTQVELVIEKQDPVYTQIQTDIVEIKTTLEFIKLNLE